MPGTPNRPILRSRIPYHPWPYFFIFLTALGLLSYGSLPIPAELWVGVLGLALPLFVALWIQLGRLRKEGPDTDGSPMGTPPPSNAWLGAFILFILFTRFFRLTSLPSWPIHDEGIVAVLGMAQSREWDWRLLWGEVHFEPLVVWTLGLFFKAFEPSLLSLRLFPALVSVATVGAAYWAPRPFLGPAFSLCFSAAVGLSFWGLSLSRFCSPTDLIPLFGILSFGFLFRFLGNDPGPKKWCYLGGAWLGTLACIYSFTNGVVVWAAVVLFLVLHSIPRDGLRAWVPLLFIASSCLAAFPLALARMSPAGISHIQGSFAGIFPLESFASYLYWICLDGTASFPFGSAWGGYLNPLYVSGALLGGLFFLGSFGVKRTGVLLLLFLLLLAPGGFSRGCELHRVLPAVVLLSGMASYGFLRLAGALPSFGRWAFLGILCLASFALDAYHFSVPYSEPTRASWTRWRNPEYRNAHRILEAESRQSGALYVFSEFSMDYDNKTLNVACYPFDALQNPKGATHSPRIASMVLKVDYAPYFLRSYPGTSFKKLPGSDLGLFLIPTDSIPGPVLGSWIEADRFCRKLNLDTKGKRSFEPWDRYAAELLTAKHLFRLDPLLRSIFWEKVAFFRYLSADFEGAAKAYELAIRQGLEIGHLYVNYGRTLQLTGEREKGAQALEKAERIFSKFR